MTQLVHPGDTFPRMTLRLTDGRTLDAPDDFDADFTAMIFFRGHW